jgi:hypothetical protein
MDKETNEKCRWCKYNARTTIHRLCLSLSEIAALTLTGRDVGDEIFTICKRHVGDLQIKEAYLNAMKKDVEAKLKEVAE